MPDEAPVMRMVLPARRFPAVAEEEAIVLEFAGRGSGDNAQVNVLGSKATGLRVPEAKRAVAGRAVLL
jgi:hypothetical protein